MGKNLGVKKWLTETPLQPVSSFFSPAGMKPEKDPGDCLAENMAISLVGNAMQRLDLMGRQEIRDELMACFATIETQIMEWMTALLAPLEAQMQEIQKNGSEVAQTADAAMELSLSMQESSR